LASHDLVSPLAVSLMNCWPMSTPTCNSLDGRPSWPVPTSPCRDRCLVPEAFEERTAWLLERDGCTILRRRGGPSDQGADVIAHTGRAARSPGCDHATAEGKRWLVVQRPARMPGLDAGLEPTAAPPGADRVSGPLQPGAGPTGPLTFTHPTRPGGSPSSGRHPSRRTGTGSTCSAASVTNTARRRKPEHAGHPLPVSSAPKTDNPREGSDASGSVLLITNRSDARWLDEVSVGGGAGDGRSRPR
jgi:hypothetical protein